MHAATHLFKTKLKLVANKEIIRLIQKLLTVQLGANVA